MTWIIRSRVCEETFAASFLFICLVIGSLLVFMWNPNLGMPIYNDTMQTFITREFRKNILFNTVSAFEYQADNEVEYYS